MHGMTNEETVPKAEPGKEPRRTGVPPGGPLFFLVLAALLVVGALLVPGEWIVKVSQLYNTPESQVDAFDISVRQVDEALRKGAQLPVTRTQFRSIEPHLAARRLASIGKATAEELREAAKIFREYRQLIAREKLDGSKSAVRAVRNDALDRALPRVSRDAIEAELDKLQGQVDAAQFLDESDPKSTAEGAGAFSEDCASCHLELVSLPAGKSIDLEHLWPTLDTERLGSGAKLPDMMSAAETSDCVECHAPHGADDFGVRRKMRADNLGLWVHARQVESVVQVQVKIQNIGAGHRVPAGPISRAYVAVVRAEKGGQGLAPWWGERLPEPVADASALGLFMGRTAIGADGAFTSDPRAVVDLLEDSRLENERFYDEYFLFEVPQLGSTDSRQVDVAVELHYFPDWLKDESIIVQRATRQLTLR